MFLLAFFSIILLIEASFTSNPSIEHQLDYSSYALAVNLPQFTNTRRIFGGTAVDFSEFPFIAAILNIHRKVTCSGVIVKPKWLLTAGHCIQRPVRYVAYKYGHPSVEYDIITKSYRHPLYLLKEVSGLVVELQNDIGLLTYNRTFQIDLSEESQHLTLSFTNPLYLSELEFASYGYGMDSEKGVTGVLRKLDIVLIDCVNENWHYFVCGKVRAPSDPGGNCPGDSGGAVVAGRALVGINSLGPALCAVQTGDMAPSAYTDIYRYLTWIKLTVDVFNTELANVAVCLERWNYIGLLTSSLFVKRLF